MVDEREPEAPQTAPGGPLDPVQDVSRARARASHAKAAGARARRLWHALPDEPVLGHFVLGCRPGTLYGGKIHEPDCGRLQRRGTPREPDDRWLINGAEWLVLGEHFRWRACRTCCATLPPEPQPWDEYVAGVLGQSIRH